MSRYYQGYQPSQRRQQDFSDIERMRLEQQQRQQQGQSQQGDNMNGMGKLAKYFNGGGGETIPSGGGQSFGGGNSAYGGIDIPASTGGGTVPEGGAWYSNLFSGGSPAAGGTAAGGEGGASAAASSNPYGWIAAALLSANVAHNKGISSWNENLKGHLAGNSLDYYQRGNHGIGSKIFDGDGTVGQTAKGFTDFMSLDPKNGIENTLGGVKSFFKGKLFG
jgi:hypothetical protein